MALNKETYAGIQWSEQIMNTMVDGIPAHGEGHFSCGCACAWCLLSCVGVHGMQRYYLGDTCTCIACLLTCGFWGWGSIIDAIMLSSHVNSLNFYIDQQINAKNQRVNVVVVQGQQGYAPQQGYYPPGGGFAPQGYGGYGAPPPGFPGGPPPQGWQGGFPGSPPPQGYPGSPPPPGYQGGPPPQNWQGGPPPQSGYQGGPPPSDFQPAYGNVPGQPMTRDGPTGPVDAGSKELSTQ